jgi:hypothetical protein
MKKIQVLLLSLCVMIAMGATSAFAVLSAEATAAQDAVEGLIVDMSGLGWSIATALIVALAGIGLFKKFVSKGGAR